MFLQGVPPMGMYHPPDPTLSEPVYRWESGATALWKAEPLDWGVLVGLGNPEKISQAATPEGIGCLLGRHHTPLPYLH